MSHRVTAPAAFTVFPMVTVVGFDSEFADIDNPRGARFATDFVVYARDEEGNSAESPALFRNDEAGAERYATALRARLAAGKLPVGFDRWAEARPVYGSDAYVAYGAADDLALEAREAEDEAGIRF
jgi:hypothetical protein